MTDSLLLEDTGGRVVVPASTIARIVVRAAESVPGTRVRRPRRGLDVSVGGGRARVSLELTVRYGEVLPEVARAVQERVAEALRAMCGVEVDAVDVSVEELVR